MANHTTVTVQGVGTDEAAALIGRGPRFRTVAAEVFRRYGRKWKPSTAKVNRSCLRSQLLPQFGERDIAGVSHADVQQWFASLGRTPAAANRALAVLSVVLEQAELYGLRPEGSNPCRGIRRYVERRCERFLNDEELRRLGSALRMAAVEAPVTATLVQLLILTGCRQSEIRTLRWLAYREGHLHLEDGKGGPRLVWLSTPARRLLDELPRDGPFAFPASRQEGPMCTETLYRFWRPLRQQADLPGLRLHDLRHSYASFALRRGVAVPTIGRLLGHRDPATTLRYTHLDEGAVREAAALVGSTLRG